MNRISVFAIIFILFIPLGSYAQYASSSKTPKKAGDLIESTSYLRKSLPASFNTPMPAVAWKTIVSLWKRHMPPIVK